MNKANLYFDLAKKWIKNKASVQELEELKETLRYHEWKYYVNNDPLISDFEYDQLFQQLKDIESSNPELITSDSPTQRVSNDTTEGFASAQHLVPMLSLDNSYSAEDLNKFDEQVKKLCDIDVTDQIEYCVEPKFDGGSIALIYENDQFVRAATRGNGIEGEEMTANARTLPSVPLNAPFSRLGISTAEIRGEAVIRKDIFKKLNEKRAEEGKSIFANPRNSATGGLRMKNPNESRERGLEVFAFQLSYAVDDQGNDTLRGISKHSKQISLLGDLGFKIPSDKEIVCKDINEVVELINDWELSRDQYPYEIDGIVVKVNERELQERCGSTQHHPRWAIAYKFKAKQATSTLIDVEYQVGKVGSITPVAKVEPVQLAGVTVSSISLHNEEFILSKDLRIGDQVVVERAGDVIPYIVKSLSELRTGQEEAIKFPRHCPINKSETAVELVKEEGESAWRCPNCICGAQELQKIIFHVSKVAMDIDGFGKAYVERFAELGWIKDISDVYNLDYKAIAQIEGFGQKSADNLYTAIEKAKNNPISKLLHSLSIHHFGKKASKLIAEQIESVFDLKDWNEEQFLEIKDIGPVVAENVMAYFSNQENVELLERLESLGVNMSQTPEDKPLEVADDAPLKGKTILFTGTLMKMGRTEAKSKAEMAGAKNTSTVSKNLNILVVGEKAGSKLKKAQDLGTVEIWTEDEFIQRVN